MWDARLAIALLQSFHELVLNEVLVDKLSTAQDHGEHDAPLAESAVADERPLRGRRGGSRDCSQQSQDEAGRGEGGRQR